MDINPRHNSRRKLIVYVGVFILIFVAAVNSAWGKGPVYARVQVTLPYIEVHTGPGRGYPVFHVVKKGQWVDVLKRRTDWFKIRTQKDREGWVSRSEMETTVTELGEKSHFRDNLLKEFFSSRLEMGVAGGTFKGDPLMVTQLGFRLNPNLSSELAIAQISGTFSSFTLIYGSLTAHPWHDARFSPYFSIGAGSFNNVPRGTLVSAIETDAVSANAGVGARFYITRNFVFRGEFRYYNAVIDGTQTLTYPAWSAGFSFFY